MVAYGPKTKPKMFLGAMLLLLSGGFVLVVLSNIAFGFTVASVLIALLVTAILWAPIFLFGLAFVTGGAIDPKTLWKKLFGAWLLLCSVGWVLGMLKNVADGSLDGNARAFALMALVFSAVFWLPAFIFGLKFVTGGSSFWKRGRATQLTCPQCGGRRKGDSIFCSSCELGSHLQKICAKCGNRLGPFHKFCRSCGASTSMN